MPTIMKTKSQSLWRAMIVRISFRFLSSLINRRGERKVIHWNRASLSEKAGRDHRTTMQIQYISL
jgi:hypothetical protein